MSFQALKHLLKMCAEKTPDLDNPYLTLRRVFIDFPYSKSMKIHTCITLLFHFLSLILEIHYLVTNFSFELSSRYGCMMCLMTYVISVKIFVIMFAKPLKILEEQRELHFWKIGDSSHAMQQSVATEALQVKKQTYFALSCFVLLAVILYPVWGHVNDLFMFSQVYEKYFGDWSVIPYYFYVFTFMSSSFNSFQLPGVILYFTLHLNLQISLINEKITKISGENYCQDEVFKQLRDCISYHVALERWMARLIDLTKTAMPVFILLGALSSIAVSFFVLYSLENTRFILKIRLTVVAICNVLIVATFAKAGQRFSDKTGLIFDAIATCPWYSWNVPNRKIVLIFMANCLKPKTFSWAGITLNYQFAIKIVRTSCSYALVLYKLRNGNY
ncbi:odorant receptor 172 [Tribolium castaneum]|uniref:Odorant receptor n=1 Tax=Tribolium castaneum TaxID=7070 RepID=D6WEN5_TRICA|nr:odorant receptor 172 [Tribolium castaneum]